MHSMTYAVKYIPRDAKRKQLFTYRFPRYSQRATALIREAEESYGPVFGVKNEPIAPKNALLWDVYRVNTGC